MIKPRCDKCGEELSKYGGLAFSPPETNPDDSCGREVRKYHLCPTCWTRFIAWLCAPASLQAAAEMAGRELLNAAAIKGFYEFPYSEAAAIILTHLAPVVEAERRKAKVEALRKIGRRVRREVESAYCTHPNPPCEACQAKLNIAADCDNIANAIECGEEL